MKMLLFLLYYAAPLSLSARQVEPVDFKAWSGLWVYNDRQDNGDVKKTQYVMPIYYIDTSVLLEIYHPSGLFSIISPVSLAMT